MQKDVDSRNKKSPDLNSLQPDRLKRLFGKHLQGAFVRSGASLFMWLFVLISLFYDTIHLDAFKGVSASVAFLILMNVPTLWVLRSITKRRLYGYFSLFINLLEIMGYTAVLYFLGGIRATFMLPIYTALIAYVGVIAPRRLPIIITGLCAVIFSSMVLLEHSGYIPHQNLTTPYNFQAASLVLMLIMIAALFYVVAFIATYTSQLLKKNRDSLRQRNVELEQSRMELGRAFESLRKKNIELKAAIEKTRDSDRLKSQFLANMSHEIRTPMNSVIGFTDMLIDSDLNEDQKDYATTIKSSGAALLSLINDILDFSKIEAGELDFEEVDFDPELLAYDVCEAIRPRVGSKPIEIICHIGDNVPAYIKGDPGRFRQVLTNMMGNASKFTDEGEIELALDVETEKDDQIKLHARVRDTGIGIPKDKLKTIFEPFHQADSSTTRRYGGTGLGLSICRKISNLMDGDVWAESKDNKGTIFHFTAWLKKVEEKEVKRFTPVSLSGKKVLIVDDIQRNLDILAHLLTSVGMNVVALRNGGEVIPTLQKNLKAQDPCTLCIMDIQMPDMSGYEIAKQIRNSETEIRRLPMIALSSLMEPDAKKCKEAGFDGFLSKPIRREKLFQMLERILVTKEGEKEKPDVIKPQIHTQYSVREEIKHSVRILLAEDNPVNQKLATLMLTKAGYQVEVVDNGKKAVDKYTAAPSDFDLIFMDVQMPEMDGLEATRAIRDKGFDRIPIIAMTAHAMKGDREKCLETGMDDYITKPIKREIVFDILENWVFK